MAGKVVDPIKSFTANKDTPLPRGMQSIPMGNYRTIKDHAKAFVGGMSTEQRKRFKVMLDHGIDAGRTVAEVYQVDPDQFITAVKAILA